MRVGATSALARTQEVLMNPTELLVLTDDQKRSIAVGKCPFCRSNDVDWGFDGDGKAGENVMELANCGGCLRVWEMHYGFTGLRVTHEGGEAEAEAEE